MNDRNTDELKELLTDAMEHLREERDELNLKMHLASAEIRDEWTHIEKRWQHFLVKAHEVEGVAIESSQEVGAAAILLGEELKKGFARMKKML